MTERRAVTLNWLLSIASGLFTLNIAVFGWFSSMMMGQSDNLNQVSQDVAAFSQSIKAQQGRLDALENRIGRLSDYLMQRKDHGT